MNATMAEQIEVICSNKQVKESAYGHKGTARIVRRNGKPYLIVDEWCGSNVEGFCFREFVYTLNETSVEGCRSAIENGEFQEWYRSLSGSELCSCGRRSDLKWSKNL